jgi:hypothetical protein
VDSVVTGTLLSAAELRLTRVTGPFEELHLDNDTDAGLGCILITEHGPGFSSFNIGVRAGLSFAQRQRFAEWARERILRWLQHGPEPDGWHKRALDGKWQLWARETWLPDPG